MTRARAVDATALSVAHDPRTPPLLWIDGRRADPAAAHLSAFDRGFTLADGLFETVRMYDGVPFRAAAHLARLADGARLLDIALPDGLATLIDDAAAEAGRAGVRDASLRLTVSRGAAGPGLAPPADARPTVVLAIQPLPPFPESIYSRGIAARIADAARNERSVAAGIKSLSYTESVIAFAAARAAGADDAIFLDTEGHVAEATASNIFAVFGDRLITPPRRCGVLAGITRAAVIELAPTLSLQVHESPLEARALRREAAEAFLTSSLREITPLVRLDDQPIGTGLVGPVARAMIEAYRALVRRECAV